MSNSAPRRVLKSVVSPALGAAFASMLVMNATGCEKSRDSATADDVTKPHGPDPVATSSSSADASPFVAVPDPSESASAPTLPDPGKSPPPVGTVKPYVPKPGKTMPKPGPVPKVGRLSDPDLEDHTLRPTRPTRRATDETHQAMTGTPRRLV
jgi:hypothetical protein